MDTEDEEEPKRKILVSKEPVKPDFSEISPTVGQFARNTIMAVHNALGGAQAMAEWAADNRTDFYTKLFPRIVTKEVEQRHSGEDLEHIIKEIERRRDENMIDVTPEEVDVA